MILEKEERAYTCDGEVYVNKIKKNVKSVEALKITSTDVKKVCINIDTYQENNFEYCYSIQDYQEDVENTLYLLEDDKGGYCQVIPVNLDSLLNQGFKEVRMKLLSNAFSLQMLQGDCNLKVTELEDAQFKKATTGVKSVVGHPDTAKVLGVEFNRESVSLSQGDVLYVAQLQGGRLPEGVTTLPEGFSFKYLKVEVL